MCDEFESWIRHRRGTQPAQREQRSPPIPQRPAEPVPLPPGVKVYEPAPRFTQREKQPA